MFQAWFKINRNEIVRHLVVWILLTVFFCIIDPVQGSFGIQLTGTFLIMAAYMFAYYAQYLFAFPKFYKINYLKLFLLIAGVFMIYLLIIFFNFFFLLHVFGDQLSSNAFFDWVFSEFILFAIITIMALGSFQNKVSLNKIKMQNEKEKALLIKELGFFKNQFNSHITFNFLNYCYNYVNELSKEAGEVIVLYSDILRYTINNKPDELVPLEKEVDYINQFINLKKTLSAGINSKFQTEGDLANKYILPRVLITFVENAFKHGQTHNIESPISIKLSVINECIKFEVSNKKNLGTKLTSTGVGQLNVMQQLNLFYNKTHKLTVNEDAESYNCILMLNI